MDEPTPSQPNGSARPKLARALTANVRRSGEKSSVLGRVLTAGLVVVLAGALAVGIGALTVKHTKNAKPSNAANAEADPSKSKSPSHPPLANAPLPVPIAPPGKAAPGARKPTPGAKKSSKATKSSGSGSGAAGTLSGAKSPASTNQVQAASVPTVGIVSYASGKCIDVTSEGQTGIPIEIWQCSPMVAWKSWAFYSDGTIRSQGHCLTVAGGSANGAPIEVAGCNGGAAQRFNLNSSHDLVNIAADKCVDVKDKKTDNGTRLQLWSCRGTSNQKWHT